MEKINFFLNWRHLTLFKSKLNLKIKSFIKNLSNFKQVLK